MDGGANRGPDLTPRPNRGQIAAMRPAFPA